MFEADDQEPVTDRPHDGCGGHLVTGQCTGADRGTDAGTDVPAQRDRTL
jgi:hypothetical protein